MARPALVSVPAVAIFIAAVPRLSPILSSAPLFSVPTVAKLLLRTSDGEYAQGVKVRVGCR